MEQALIFFWRPNLWPPCRKGTQNYFDDLLSCPVLSCSAPVIAQPRFFYTWILAVEILRIHKMLLFRISVCSVNCTWSKPTYVYKKWSPNVWQLAMRVLCNYVIHIWTWVETYGVLSYTSQFSVIHTILRSIYGWVLQGDMVRWRLHVCVVSVAFSCAQFSGVASETMCSRPCCLLSTKSYLGLYISVQLCLFTF